MIKVWAILHPAKWQVVSWGPSGKVKRKFFKESVELDYAKVKRWWAPKSERKNRATLAAFKECYRPDCEFVKCELHIPRATKRNTR